MKVIKSIAELKKLAGTDEGVEVAILLNHGVYSRKHIYYTDNSFGVYNFIDDTQQELTEAEIMDERISHVGLAIKRQALVLT